MAELTINTSDITSALKRNLDGFKPSVEATQVGRVLEVGDGIARVSALPDCAVNELVEFEGGTLGVALNLDEDSIGAVILGDSEHAAAVEEGSLVRATGRILSVPVGDALLGRVVNPLGEPIDGNGPLGETVLRRLEMQAPGVTGRKPVHEPLQTGIKSIDAMTPIGRGQRELIIGDRKTGKTTVCIDTILNQRGLGVKCIYVAIGQKGSTDRPNGQHAARAWRPRLHGRCRRARVASRHRSSTWPPTRVARWASTGWRTVSMRSSCTTTCPNKPRRTASSRCCSVARPGARPIRATCSTCTVVCSSGRPS